MIKTFRESLSLLATRRFGTFWFASLLSSIGTWAQQVAEPWLLLTLGASSFLIGLDSFAMNAPVWLLTLAGGALADRSDRRRVIALFQSIQMLCPTAIVVLLITGTVKPTTWEDVGGLDEIKHRLREAIEWPLAYPHLFDLDYLFLF